MQSNVKDHQLKDKERILLKYYAEVKKTLEIQKNLRACETKLLNAQTELDCANANIAKKNAKIEEANRRCVQLQGQVANLSLAKQ